MTRKIVIEILDNSDTIVTYENDKIRYPICRVSDNDFVISDITHVTILTLVADFIAHLGRAFSRQLDIQRFVSKTLNKSNEGK